MAWVSKGEVEEWRGSGEVEERRGGGGGGREAGTAQGDKKTTPDVIWHSHVALLEPVAGDDVNKYTAKTTKYCCSFSISSLKRSK